MIGLTADRVTPYRCHAMCCPRYRVPATAKTDVAHGEWLPMLAEVGISESRARYLMSIGRNLNRLNSDDLPSSIDALEMPDGQRIAGDAEQVVEHDARRR